MIYLLSIISIIAAAVSISAILHQAGDHKKYVDCMYCKRIYDRKEFAPNGLAGRTTGICPACLKKHHPTIYYRRKHDI